MHDKLKKYLLADLPPFNEMRQSEKEASADGDNQQTPAQQYEEYVQNDTAMNRLRNIVDNLPPIKKH